MGCHRQKWPPLKTAYFLTFQNRRRLTTVSVGTFWRENVGGNYAHLIYFFLCIVFENKNIG